MAQTATPRRPAHGRQATEPKKRVAVAKKGASSIINIRVDNETRSLFNRAKDAIGENMADFIRHSARVRAQEVLLSQTHFVLSDKDWTQFQAALEAPLPAAPALVALMASSPPWGE